MQTPSQTSSQTPSQTPKTIRLFDSLPCYHCGAPAFLAQVEPATTAGKWLVMPLCAACQPVKTMCLLPHHTSQA